jgi:ABC-type bacteriocin/lantibiotic exporter with double-glycine peptidase domain
VETLAQFATLWSGTLDVLIIGLLAVGGFEVVLGTMRTYLFSHTTNHIDAELGARLFRHLFALRLAYLYQISLIRTHAPSFVSRLS